jgi:formate/nitrite transporter FocA (FNT family)
MTQHITRITLITIVLLGANLAANHLLHIQWHRFAWVMYPFFGVMQCLAHTAITRAAARSPQKFVTAFMAATGIKLAACFVLLGLLVFFDKPHAKPIALWFMLLYFVLTTYETIILSRQARKK